MLIHIVMFRRRPEVPRDEAAEAVFVQQLHALPGAIPLIRRWRLSVNELHRAASWNYVLESAFDDVDGLDRYLVHPQHLAIVGSLKHYFEWAACDYTLSSGDS